MTHGSTLSRWIRAGVATGIVDWLFATFLSGVVYRTGVTRLWQGVASVLLGPFIWMVMSLLLIPAFTGRMPAITVRWWVNFFGHIPFVAMPMLWAIGRGQSHAENLS